jgi:serine/threonine-protein kinase
MADVFLAKLSGEFAKLSVVKRLKPAEDDDPEIIHMFADEARLSARLNHPSIVQTFEVGEDDNGPFLVMEYVEGQSLGRLRSRAQRRGTPLPRAMALKIVRETIGALEYAHNLQDHDGSVLRVVHRDVSPENIMVTYAGMTKLIDFGVAKTAASMSKTRAGVLKGKVAYMAPEQARSDENIDERVDVFAVGLILWELLTGQRMWEGMSEAKVFERLLDRAPLPRAREVAPDVPHELDVICSKAIAKDKDDRYANMGELMDAVETAIAKLDLRASDREIGQFVSSLFEVEREKVKALVASAAARKDDSAPSQPEAFEDSGSDPLLWRGASSGSKSAPTEDSSKSDKSKEISKIAKIQASSLVPSAVGSLGNSTTEGGVENTKVAAAQLRKNPLKPVLAAAGIVLVVIIAVMVGKTMASSDTPAVTEKPIEPLLPTIDTNVTPSTPAPTQETNLENDVTIDITVRPSNARLYLDGNRVNGNPYHLKTSRGSAIHELRADADGFETRTMTMVFDKDRTVELSLSRANPGYVPPPRPDQPAPKMRPAPAPQPAPAPAPPGTNQGDPNKP